MEAFEKERLKNFDGKEGRAPYVAVDGKVYDLSFSELWKGGEHMGQHAAGQEMSEAIKGAPHGREVLERVKQVGILKTDDEPAAKAPPAWALLLLKLHPHPICVHFPQALLFFAPLFLVLFYVVENPHLERTAYYLIIAGWITSIPAIKTGIFHWIYKHGKSGKGIYKFKLVLSILLFLFGGVVIYVHSAKGVLAAQPLDMPLMALYLLLLPMILALGHAGGKIAFG
jgi:predicted heme/steroid binding protein/uncharacterized membrane protein